MILRFLFFQINIYHLNNFQSGWTYYSESRKKEDLLIHVLIFSIKNPRKPLIYRKKYQPSPVGNRVSSRCEVGILLKQSFVINGQKLTAPGFKGQLLSKCLFGVFKFFQKANENKSTWGIIVVKSNFFVCFLKGLKIPKSSFEINWPLGHMRRCDLKLHNWQSASS